MEIKLHEPSFDELNDARRDAEIQARAYHDVYTEGKLEAMVIDIEHNRENLMRLIGVLLSKKLITIEELDNL